MSHHLYRLSDIIKTIIALHSLIADDELKEPNRNCIDLTIVYFLLGPKLCLQYVWKKGEVRPKVYENLIAKVVLAVL